MNRPYYLAGKPITTIATTYNPNYHELISASLEGTFLSFSYNHYLILCTSMGQQQYPAMKKILEYAQILDFIIINLDRTLYGAFALKHSGT